MSTLVRITAHNTPHHTDPAGAREFYAALGMLSVAWGRLEGHLAGNLLTMMNLLTPPIDRLPFRWDERRRMWTQGFSLPVLQSHKDRAVKFLCPERIQRPIRWGSASSWKSSASKGRIN
jgi:hypothetical protein